MEYNFDLEDGHRVVSALVRCGECNVPSYSILNETAYYKVIVPSFLLTGGDGYTMMEEHEPYTERLEKIDQVAFGQFVQARHYVYPENEGRIVIRGSTDGASGIVGSIALLMVSSLLTRLFN